jgi:hypothetical protein
MNEWIIDNIEFINLVDINKIPCMQIVGLECYCWYGTSIDEFLFVNVFSVIL